MQTSIRIELSQVVDGEPGRLWALVSSPAAWSLMPGSPFMFPVPGATPSLRLYIGPAGRGIGSGLYEVADEVPGANIRLRSLPTGRQEFTVSVRPGRRGTTRASLQTVERVPRKHEVGYEITRRKEIKSWLLAVRSVIEGRAPWPGADMTLELRDRCTARPRLDNAPGASASVTINADPATVWDVVHSPESARFLGAWPAVYSGHVPSTPQEQVGEMQYFIRPRSDGQLAGEVVVVTELSERWSAVTHVLRAGYQFEQRYQLARESASGPTQLDLTWRWSAPNLTGEAADAVRSELAESIESQAASYKSLIESAGEQPTEGGSAAAGAPERP